MVPYQRRTTNLSQVNWANPIVSRIGYNNLTSMILGNVVNVRYIKDNIVSSSYGGSEPSATQLGNPIIISSPTVLLGTSRWSVFYRFDVHYDIATETHLYFYDSNGTGVLSINSDITSYNALNDTYNVFVLGNNTQIYLSLPLKKHSVHNICVNFNNGFFNVWMNGRKVTDNLYTGAYQPQDCFEGQFIKKRLPDGSPSVLITTNNHNYTDGEAVQLTTHPYSIFTSPTSVNTRIFEKQEPKKVPLQTHSIKTYNQFHNDMAVDWGNSITQGLVSLQAGTNKNVFPVKDTLDSNTTVKSFRSKKLVLAEQTNNFSGGFWFPKLKYSAQTLLLIQFCTSRRLYGSWMGGGVTVDKFPGEYNDNELRWVMHGTGWNTSTEIFGGGTPMSLVGSERTIIGTWNKDKNNGFGRMWVDGIEITRTGGTPLVDFSDRTNSSANPTTGPAQSISGVALWAVFNRDLSVAEVKSLSTNPWQLFANPNTTKYFLPSTLNRSPIRLINDEILQTQPQNNASVDWSNKLTNGLVTAVLPSVGPTNLAGPETTKFGSIISGSSNIIGNSAVILRQTGTQDGIRITDSVRQRTQEVTAFVLFRRTGIVDPNSDIIRKNWQTDAAPTYVSWSISLNPQGFGQNVIRTNTGISGNITAGTQFTLSDSTQWNSAVYVKRSGFTDLYINGVLRFSDSTGTIVYGTSGNNDIMTSGKVQPTDYAILLTWNRALTSQEIARISSNPWQLFQNKSQIYLQPPLQREIGKPIPMLKDPPVVGRQPKPLTPINWSNNITRSLLTCLAATPSSLVYDTVNNFKVADTGGYTQAESVTLRRTIYGNAFATNGGSYKRGISFPEVLQTEPDLTTIIVFSLQTNTTGINLISVGGKNYEVPSSISIDTTNILSAIQGQDTVTGKITHQTSLIVGNLNVVIYTNKHKVGDALQTLWLNGIKGNTTTTSSAQASYRAANISIGSGANPSTCVNFYYGAVWNRILSDNEIISLSKNPWQLFDTEPKPVFMPTIQTVIKKLRRRIMLIS